MRRVRLDVASVVEEGSGGGGRGVVEKFNAAVRMNSKGPTLKVKWIEKRVCLVVVGWY